MMHITKGPIQIEIDLNQLDEKTATILYNSILSEIKTAADAFNNFDLYAFNDLALKQVERIDSICKIYEDKLKELTKL